MRFGRRHARRPERGATPGSGRADPPSAPCQDSGQASRDAAMPGSPHAIRASGVALEGLVPDFRLVWVGLSAVKGQVRCRSMRRQLGPRHGSGTLHRGDAQRVSTVRGPGGGRLGVAGDELPSLRSGPIGAFESRRPRSTRAATRQPAWGCGQISWRRRWPARRLRPRPSLRWPSPRWLRSARPREPRCRWRSCGPLAAPCGRS